MFLMHFHAKVYSIIFENHYSKETLMKIFNTRLSHFSCDVSIQTAKQVASICQKCRAPSFK